MLSFIGKRWLSFSLIVVVIVFLIIGYQVWIPNTPSATAAPITIKLSGWGASQTEKELLRQVLKDFETLHPHIKVKHEVIADQYMDVLKTRLIGDAGSDVFYLDVSEAPFLVSKNVLEPLDNYITPDFDLEDFEDPLLNCFRHDDQIYGLPKDYSTLVLFYNKNAFAEVGLTSPPKTWQEFRNDARQLTLDRNQDGRIEQYGFGETPALARQVYKIKAFGGELINDQGYAAFADDQGLKGLQLVIDQYRQDRSSVQPSDVGTSSDSEMFGQGKVAMMISGNWSVPYISRTFPDIDFGIAEIPTINHQSGTMMFTVAYVMNKQTEYKEAAWELISYLTGKQGMERWTSTGFALPTRHSVADALGYTEDSLQSPLIAGVDYGTPWQGGDNLSIISSNFNNQFISALLGEQSLADAMTKAQESANKQIEWEN